MRFLPVLTLVGALLAYTNAHADDVVEQHLTLKNHAFVPRELAVPAGQKIKLIIANEDSAAAEFESFALNREKVVAANGTITVFVGPLDAGSYAFFDDFHRDTTTGTLIVK
jgi:plastocyanin